MSLTIERSTILATARSVVDRAKASGRELSQAEQAEVEGAIAKVHDLDARAKSASLVDRVLALGPGPDPEASGEGLFTAEAKAGIIHATKTRTTYRTTVDAKAALGSGSLIPTVGTGVEPGIYPGGAYPLSSLFRQASAEGPVQRYYRMGAGTASVVAEGALKPDAGVDVTAVDLVLEKIACLAQVTDELIEDAGFLVDAIAAELRSAVATTENARILYTFTTTSGILLEDGTPATVVDDVADAIAAQESSSGKTPTAVIAHPNVVAEIRKSKASTSGTYVLDPTAPGPSSIFGVPVISTPAASATVVWIVERSGVTIFRRGGLVVDFGTNADDFAHNTQTARAEERMGTAVTRPSSLTKLTLTP